jgi:hypothetical protein
MPKFPFRSILALAFLVIAASLPAQRTPESIGRQVLEALKAKDFSKLEAMMPGEALIGKLRAQDAEEEEGDKSDATDAEVRARMRSKMEEELQDLLKSAKSNRVKLAKLKFGGIVQNLDNPGSALPMKAVVMEVRYLEKPIDIAYTVLQYEGEWYYLGILLSYDLFSQLKG